MNHIALAGDRLVAVEGRPRRAKESGS